MSLDNQDFPSLEMVPNSWSVWLQKAGFDADEASDLALRLHKSGILVERVLEMTDFDFKLLEISSAQRQRIMECATSALFRNESNERRMMRESFDPMVSLDLRPPSDQILGDFQALDPSNEFLPMNLIAKSELSLAIEQEDQSLIGQFGDAADDYSRVLMPPPSAPGVASMASTSDVIEFSSEAVPVVAARAERTTKKRKQQVFPRQMSTPAAAVAEFVTLVDQPPDQILSGRSTHLYRLSVHQHRIIEIKIFMEDENGMPLDNFVEVAKRKTLDSSDGYTLVTFKLRLKPDRLQLTNVVFELLVESLATGNLTTRRQRARACIVCSHITRQRAAAQKKLDKWKDSQSLGSLASRILDRYASFRFTRQLDERELKRLQCVALCCSPEELPNKTVGIEDAARLRAFDKWFSAGLKTMDRVRPYWDNGSIYGFVSRPAAEQLVADQDNGTAIIRLSESVPKALAVTCRLSDGQMQNKLIEHTACANCNKFVESLRSLQGGLEQVFTVTGNAKSFEAAFPEVVDVLNSKENHYDELIK